jgi:hypothetical protein
MAVIQDPVIPVNMQRIENNGAARVLAISRGHYYSQSLLTGIMAAGFTTGNTAWTMRLNPSAAVQVQLTKLRIAFTTLTAFTTPVTAGRRLALFRGVGATPTTGVAAGVTSEHDSLAPASQCDAGQGGDQRIAGTSTIATAGITFEASPLRSMTLTHLGTAGAYGEKEFDFLGDGGAPLILNPGELFAIRAPVAFDAVGTWQLGVDSQWAEVAALA